MRCPPVNALKGKPDMGPSVVYTLELENGKFYVGSTRNFPVRVAQHWLGRGSLWTRQHPPVRILEVVDGGRDVEDGVTIALMIRRGWRNVRGGSWCSLELLGMPDPLARAFAMAPPPPAPEREDIHSFDCEDQAVVVRELEGQWQARITGPLVIAHGPRSGVLIIQGDSLEDSRDKAFEWVRSMSGALRGADVDVP